MMKKILIALLFMSFGHFALAATTRVVTSSGTTTTGRINAGMTNFLLLADSRIEAAIGDTVQAYSSNLDVLATNNGNNLTITSLTDHISNGNIHFRQSDISITESQISNLGPYQPLSSNLTALSLNNGNNLTITSLTDHISNGNIHFRQSDISITESQISDLQAYLTANQTITLNGDVTGSGTTSITTTVVNDSHNHTASTITLASTDLTDTTGLARLAAAQTFTAANTFTIASGSSVAMTINKAGNNEGLVVNKTSGSGNAVTIAGGTLGTNSNINMSDETASTIAHFDASKNIKSLATSTYPSLTELSYVKGVTSAIQTQLDAKAPIDAPSFTGTVTSNGGVAFQKQAYFDAEVDDGNSGAADTIDWTLGNKHKSTLTDDCTYTFTAPSGATNILLRIVQDGTGGRTVTWPTIKWSGGTAPTLSTAAAAEDIVSCYYSGTSYYCQAGIGFATP
jgi:hypothetical protein